MAALTENISDLLLFVKQQFSKLDKFREEEEDEQLKVFEQLEYVRRSVEILCTTLNAKQNPSPKCPRVYEKIIE